MALSVPCRGACPGVRERAAGEDGRLPVSLSGFAQAARGVLHRRRIGRRAALSLHAPSGRHGHRLRGGAVLTRAAAEGEPAPGAGAGQVAAEFVLVRECCFGQTFSVVGNLPQLGSWSPDNALPMQWSEGHVWTATLALSAEELSSVEFKFVMQGKRGELEWQPSANHSLGDGSGPDFSSPGGLVVLHRPWHDEPLGPLPEALAPASTDSWEEAPPPEPAAGGNGAARSSKKKKKKAPVTPTSSGFAQVVSKDAEWGRSVWAGLLGTWGRKTLMAEEEGKKGAP